MDSLHTAGFYASSGLALAGGVLAAVLPGRGLRSLALGVAGIGAAGVEASLAAGFAALVTVVSFGGSAALLARPDYRAFDWPGGTLWRQLGALGAVLVLALLGYSAYRGAFAHVAFNGGGFGAAAVGRLLFAREAVATEAVAAIVLVSLVVMALLWRLRERDR